MEKRTCCPFPVDAPTPSLEKTSSSETQTESETAFQVYGGALLCFTPDAPLRHLPLSDISAWVDFQEKPIRTFRLKLTDGRFLTLEDRDGSLQDILVNTLAHRFLFQK